MALVQLSGGPMPVNRISRFGFVNAYLVEEEDGLTVIDTMIPRQLEGDPRRRREDRQADHDDPPHPRPRRPRRLGRRAARGAARGGGRHLRARLALPRQGDDARPRRAAGQAARQLSRHETKPTRTVAPGERVGSLEVIASPGHTPGHVSFLDIRDRTLYTGDAYSTLGGVATAAKGRPSVPAGDDRDLAQTDRGRERQGAAGAGAGAARPGHGKVVETPGAAMDAAIKRSE